MNTEGDLSSRINDFFNDPPWVDYAPKTYLEIPNGEYVDRSGNKHYFSSGPRDKYVWRLIDGKLDKGVEKSKFYKYFTAV